MKNILQIELTNHCNRRCAYCGQTNMTRPRGMMGASIFKRCIQILNLLGQKTVGLHHYGESLLHPLFLSYLRLMNDAGIDPWFNTNGDFLSTDAIKQIAVYRVKSLIISGHASYEVRQRQVTECQRYGINAVVQVEITPESALDIAGQVKGLPPKVSNPLKNPARQCRFLVDQTGIILWSGDLVPCCFDYDGVAVFGNVSDPNALDLVPKVNSLCTSCSGHPGNVIEVE